MRQRPPNQGSAERSLPRTMSGPTIASIFQSCRVTGTAPLSMICSRKAKATRLLCQLKLIKFMIFELTEHRLRVVCGQICCDETIIIPLPVTQAREGMVECDALAAHVSTAESLLCSGEHTRDDDEIEGLIRIAQHCGSSVQGTPFPPTYDTYRSVEAGRSSGKSAL